MYNVIYLGVFRFINIEFGTFIVTRRIIRNITRIISDY